MAIAAAADSSERERVYGEISPTRRPSSDKTATDDWVATAARKSGTAKIAGVEWWMVYSAGRMIPREEMGRVGVGERKAMLFRKNLTKSSGVNQQKSKEKLFFLRPRGVERLQIGTTKYCAPSRSLSRASSTLVLGSTLRTRPSDPSESRAEIGADRAEEGEERFSSAQR